jgi:hypothetical protein
MSGSGKLGHATQKPTSAAVLRELNEADVIWFCGHAFLESRNS